MPFATLPSGIELCFDERGEGSPIVLVMGIGAQMIYWPEGFCDALAARGHRVIRFDNRDVGESTWFTESGVPPVGRSLVAALLGRPIAAPYSLEDMAADAAGLVEQLGLEAAHFVGASMGGMIVQALGYTHPHRVRSIVSMMSTTGKPGVLISDPRAIRALLQPAPRTRDEAIERGVAFFRAIGSPGFDVDEASIRERSGRAWDRGVDPRGFLRQLAAIAASGDRTARLRFVRARTLVIHGDRDPLIRPVGGRLTAAAIPNARLQVVQGMGHDLPAGAWPLLSESISRHAREADELQDA